MEKLLLAIDIGTSGCKVTFFNLDGEVVASETGIYKTYYAEKNKVEHIGTDWWENVCKCIKKMILEKNIDINNVEGVGIDGLGWALIPIDREGNVLRNIMIWLDRRAEEEAEWMKKTCGEERLINISGNPIDASYITPKILWMKKHEPELYAKTYKFLNSNSYIAYKLTDEISQDYSQGYGFHFFNINTGEYDQEIASELGINLDLFAPIMNCHDIVGGITEKAAQETGLKIGTPVVAGALDAACCTLGAGVLNPGQTQEQGGQAGGMSICTDSPSIHPKLILGYHAVPDMWLLQGGTVGGGGTLNWFNRELAAHEKLIGREKGCSSFEVMSDEATKIAEGSNGLIFLPYMAGERSPIWDGNAKGAFIGLGFDKTRAHMIRSIMEGVGYSLEHNLKTAEEIEVTINKLVSVGGSANSVVWTQLKADITGKEIDVPLSDHATTLGAAILAGVGTGLYKNFEEAIKKTVRVVRQHKPNMDNHEKYKKYYQVYEGLYGSLKDTFDQLSSFK
ncbi:FGGY-family carbohydrate kinase (plasmid) [Fusobacteria bacterium ZRK30]|nr:FGGY-family carbohydrate kinase [Fusobacteria bacterium ZRK30]